MFTALDGVGIDDDERRVEVGSCFCYLCGEVGQVMVDNDVVLAGPGLGVVGLDWIGGWGVGGRACGDVCGVTQGAVFPKRCS
jgi:hypothetical protein